MLPDDRKLVRRSLDGQADAFGLLYDRHGPRVYQLLRRLTANDALAQDLAQETFLAAHRCLGDWRGQGALGTWLCGIAVRLYRNAVRTDARHPAEPLDDQEALPSPEGDPLRHLAQRELRDRLEAAIEELPPSYRDAFVLVKVEGLSYREASDWLGVPLGTVQSRLWRAVCRLQVLLKDLEPVRRGPEPAAAPDSAGEGAFPPRVPTSTPPLREDRGVVPSPSTSRLGAKPARRRSIVP
jgi:RNA polymerase sigma-70 factor, ECF subfamily